MLARELESAWQDGSIGVSLEARVDIEIAEASEFEMLQRIGDQLAEFLIVSEAELQTSLYCPSKGTMQSQV